MKFVIGRRYWSEDNYEMIVVNRFDRTGLVRVEIGFAFPSNYKIRKDFNGFEFILAKNKIYRATY